MKRGNDDTRDALAALRECRHMVGDREYMVVDSEPDEEVDEHEEQFLALQSIRHGTPVYGWVSYAMRSTFSGAVTECRNAVRGLSASQ